MQPAKQATAASPNLNMQPAKQATAASPNLHMQPAKQATACSLGWKRGFASETLGAD